MMRRMCLTTGDLSRQAGLQQHTGMNKRKKTWRMCRKGRRKMGKWVVLMTWMWSLQHWELHSSHNSSSLNYPLHNLLLGYAAAASNSHTSNSNRHSSTSM
jgi:hypothetical protein